MGQNRDAEIAAWQDRAGLILPSTEQVQWIREMKKLALELVEILVLEQSGIRDGDGLWSGCDPVGGTISQIAELGKRRAAFLDEAVPPDLSVVEIPDTLFWAEGGPEGSFRDTLGSDGSITRVTKKGPLSLEQKGVTTYPEK